MLRQEQDVLDTWFSSGLWCAPHLKIPPPLVHYVRTRVAKPQFAICDNTISLLLAGLLYRQGWKIRIFLHCSVLMSQAVQHAGVAR